MLAMPARLEFSLRIDALEKASSVVVGAAPWGFLDGGDEDEGDGSGRPAALGFQLGDAAGSFHNTSDRVKILPSVAMDARDLAGAVLSFTYRNDAGKAYVSLAVGGKTIASSTEVRPLEPPVRPVVYLRREGDEVSFVRASVGDAAAGGGATLV
eukprot:TRINITY_DN41124_c2_g1_i1.p1 TRINITY_DN41124_c2_g1~~TRINITY_DN41124_c2_g1_i1.p1  ORF type:complete len:154 (-),score=36.06 TRINITY_DN41124_c2_g1_i1:419-880(-)